MGEYRLSRLAERHLLEIHANSEDMFGRYQADAYLAGLDRTFGLLADFPLMGPNADEIVPELRRFRFQSHFVFYMPASDHIFIRGIFHIRMNIRAELFE
jgi:toxin ParE1/3/4